MSSNGLFFFILKKTKLFYYSVGTLHYHISGIYNQADESWKYHNTLESAAEMLWLLK